MFVMFLTVISLFPQTTIENQFSRPLKNVNLNLLGDGSIVSLNFEQLKIIKPNVLLSYMGGIGYSADICIFKCENRSTYLTLPHHVTVNLGKNKHFLEIGLGGTYALNISADSNKYFLYPIIGYRLQPLRPNKLNLRIFGVYPIIGDIEKDTFFPLGLSIGYNFN